MTYKCTRANRKIYQGPKNGVYYKCKNRKVYIRSKKLKQVLGQTGQIIVRGAERNEFINQLLDYGVSKKKLKKMNVAELSYMLADYRSNDQ